MKLIDCIRKFEDAIESYNNNVAKGKRPIVQPRPEDHGLKCHVGKMMAQKVLDRKPLK
ncbi:MAG: hypothetical protein WCI55_08055 [Armatimonadota bacterium]